MKNFFVYFFAVLLWASTAHAASTLTVSWQDNSNNEDGFNVERAASASGPFSRVAIVGRNATSYVNTNLSEATSYCYRTNAFNTAGASPFSGVACGVTKATLTLVKTGTGSGQVSSAPTGMSCTGSCAVQFSGNANVTLAAAAAAGSVFVGWSGACAGTGPCTVTMNSPRNVTATFNNNQAAQTFTLAVAKAGTGSGTVTATGINCGSDCSQPFNSGTSVSLTATAASGSTFTGWSGSGCTTGTVTLSANRTCTATFNAQGSQTFTLAVAKAGTGSGTVTATGINCGSDCSQPFNSGTSVSLTATPASGSTFTGWSGSGCSTGTVTLSANRTCTATFNAQAAQLFTLTVAKAGTGSGTVTATGINCGSDCSQPYNSGTAVSLTVTPSSGSVFTGWSGACSGSGSCTVTMNSQKSVTATFTSSAPLSNNSLFVRQQYLDFLDREPDAQGYSAWVNALNSGFSKATMIETFMDSGEFYFKGRFVAQAYLGILSRDADHAGFRAWLEVLLEGMSRGQIVQDFLDSGEFKAKFGSNLTNAQFVGRMYANVLLRSADTGGLNFWVGRLNSGQMTRAQVALGFLDSDEFQNLDVSQNRVDVSLLYFDMLRRDPDPDGFSAWVGALNSGLSFRAAINAFLISGEYQAQF